MSKQCCEWHDALPDEWDMKNPPEDNRVLGLSPECGLAGTGTPSVCCRNCPDAGHFTNQGLTLDYYEDEVKQS